ncbi:GNAT family N-acetyltransferase [Dyadobacter pollutisoli]|jgi:N-acetylglutamate synthase-like GNAT family acetyltransferase|uniref:GNAT family N-acetyltransferase n=1 Tax=Dyadobacter pollutisoli TaxID=2910158 RepID=A0A9E8NEB6_9BACT|nr:GNAT family N-acetyltransferase [Dyadobacter pollutisoli]WAC14408.1 GNAT family N-acetyltransferase [Dyadobacter pollutisoli]
MNSSEFLPADLEQLPALQPSDWGDLIPRFRYFIESDVCSPVKIEENGQMVAIGTSVFHSDTAWLACIVVHPDHRNKGLGNTVTRSLIDDIDRNRYETIYLDATEYGYPVYKKLGFEVETQYAHLRLETGPVALPISPNIIPYEDKFNAQVLALDRMVSGEDRSAILKDFLSQMKVYLKENQVHGFYIPGWGDGPIIAHNNEAGLELMKLRIQEYDSAVLPIANLAAMEFLNEHRFEIRKHSRRMLLGKQRDWKPELLFNRISGQLG